MSRTLATSTTAWQQIGTGPAVLTITQHVANDKIWVNSSATDDTAMPITYSPHPHNQIDWRSGEPIYIKSGTAGWKVVVDTDT